jgi:hypothetical protein
MASQKTLFFDPYPCRFHFKKFPLTSHYIHQVATSRLCVILFGERDWTRHKWNSSTDEPWTDSGCDWFSVTDLLCFTGIRSTKTLLEGRHPCPGCLVLASRYFSLKCSALPPLCTGRESVEASSCCSFRVGTRIMVRA